MAEEIRRIRRSPQEKRAEQRAKLNHLLTMFYGLRAEPHDDQDDRWADGGGGKAVRWRFFQQDGVVPSHRSGITNRFAQSVAL